MYKRRIYTNIPNLSFFQNFFSSTADEVLLNIKNKCGIITLNRPKALNSLNHNMVKLIQPTLQKWKNSKDVTHVIIEGSGDKAFCAGGDIRQVTDDGKNDPYKAAKFFRDEYCLNFLIGTFSKPYIALLNGITMGGGFGLSVHGSHRICTEKTVFAMPETAIGLFPDVGGGYVLPRLPGHIGIYLALVGHRLKGQEVACVGIGTHFVESSKILELKESLINANGLPELEQLLNPLSIKPLDPKINFSLTPYLDLIDKHFQYDTVEGILTSLASESGSETEREWCNKHIATIRKMSPSSLKITLKQLHEGASKTLSQTFTTEYRMAVGCMEHNDFYEGVRALLIDRDNSPKWKPETLELVGSDVVAKYFRPLGDDLIL